jgi:hypothetical protein
VCFDTLKARGNRPEYSILLTDSLTKRYDKFFSVIYFWHHSSLSPIEESHLSRRRG